MPGFVTGSLNSFNLGCEVRRYCPYWGGQSKNNINESHSRGKVQVIPVNTSTFIKESLSFLHDYMEIALEYRV